MSGEFRRYTPENSGNSEKSIRIDKVKKLSGELMAIKADDEEAWIKKSGIVREIFSEAGYGANSVDELKRVESDENKTEKQKELAREAKDVLVTGIYEAMLETKNEEVEKAMGMGSLSGIGVHTPRELKGLEREIVDKITGDKRVTEILVSLDGSRVRNKNNGDLGRKQFYKKLEEAYGKIDEMEGLSEEAVSGQMLVMSYLSREVEATEESELNEDGIKADSKPKNNNEEMLREIRKSNDLREKEMLKNEMEQKNLVDAKEKSLEQFRYETFQAMLLHKNPITIDVFQQYAPEWMKEEKDKPLMQTLVALANCCFYKWKYGDANLDVMVDPRAEAVFNAPNEMMQKMYEMPGVRDTMESIVETFFEQGSEEGVNEQNKKINIFVLRLKGSKGGETKEVVDRAQNIGNIQMKLVDGLVNKGFKKSDAMLAVSTAYNLLYVGHVFEDADKDRKLKPCDAYVEQMRAFMYPATKARSKYGLDKQMPANEKSNEGQKISVGTEEGWGGQLGQWLTEVVMRAKHKINVGENVNDPDIQFFYKYQRGEVHPFPERLFASFFTLTEVSTGKSSSAETSKKMSIAEALFKKEHISFIEAGKGVNPWGSYYDASDSANRLYKIVKGDQKSYSLPLGDTRALQQVASWAHEVSDARKKVRGNDILKPHVGGREFVKWIIAACVQGGIYPHSAELVLLTPDVEADQDVSFDGLLKRRDLLEDENDKKWLKKEFHAENFVSRFTRMRIIKRMGKRRQV